MQITYGADGTVSATSYTPVFRGSRGADVLEVLLHADLLTLNSHAIAYARMAITYPDGTSSAYRLMTAEPADTDHPASSRWYLRLAKADTAQQGKCVAHVQLVYALAANAAEGTEPDVRSLDDPNHAHGYTYICEGGTIASSVQETTALDAAAALATVSAAAASAAQTAAETAKAAAETAEDGAEAAQTASEAAQTAAETAKTDAEAAQAAAETAKTDAITAKTDAVTAKTAAETAQNGAETAKTDAVTAKTDAVTAKTAAVTAKTAAETAQAAAEAAQTGAVTAKAAAETAAETAQTAATSAAASAAGKAKAVAFDDYAAVVAEFNEAAADKYLVGQSIFVKDTGVPDLWVYAVNDSSSTCPTTPTAADFARGAAIGYYVLAALETEPEYTLPAASASTLGGVKVGTGLSITDGVLSAQGDALAAASVAPALKKAVTGVTLSVSDASPLGGGASSLIITGAGSQDGQYVGDLVASGEHAGQYAVPISIRGKNLFDKDTVTDLHFGKTIVEVGGKLDGVRNYSPWALQDVGFRVSVGGVVCTVSADLKCDTCDQFAVGFAYTDGTNLIGAPRKDDTDWWRCSCTSEQGKTVDRIIFVYHTYGISGGIGYTRNIQLELGSAATDYEPYHAPVTKTLYLAAPLRAGDTVDAVTGAISRGTPLSGTVVDTASGVVIPLNEDTTMISLGTENAPTNLSITYNQDLTAAINDILSAIAALGTT